VIIQNDRPAHASIERTAAWYCLGQSVLTLVWWGWLVVFPEHRAFFWPEDWPPLSLNAFCLADILFIAMLGLIVSAFAFQQSPFSRPGLWLMLGAIGYASTYTISVAIGTGQGLLGATCMGMATIGFAHLTLAEMLADRDRVSDLFRTASNATAGRHRLATPLSDFFDVAYDLGAVSLGGLAVGAIDRDPRLLQFDGPDSWCGTVRHGVRGESGDGVDTHELRGRNTVSIRQDARARCFCSACRGADDGGAIWS